MRSLRSIGWILLALQLASSTARAEGWSLDNVFGGNKSKTATKSKWKSDFGTPKQKTPGLGSSFGTKKSNTTNTNRTIGYDPTRNAAKTTKPSVWEQWFGKKQEAPPATVGEWMKQPRVKP